MSKNRKIGEPQGWSEIRFTRSKELDTLGKKVLFPTKVSQSRALLAQVAW